MDGPLEWREYDPVHMAKAANDFQCSGEWYDKEVKRWPVHQANEEMQLPEDDRTRVWVHLDPNSPDRIIAFGALSRATWPYDESTAPFPTYVQIDALAVHRDFRRGGALRRADGPQYGRRLLEDLLLPHAEAMQIVGERRVGLFVRPENTAAIALYTKVGFSNTGPPDYDRAGVLHFYSKPLGPFRPKFE